MKVTFYSVALWCVATLASASLQFESSLVSLQAQTGEDKVFAHYSFKNTGSRTITILNTSSSCGCTVPKLEKSSYEPGEEGVISAEFTIGSRKGLQRKTIRVTTDEVPASRYQLQLEVDIPVILSASPRVLTWTKSNAGKAQKVVAKLGAPEDYTVEGLKSDLERFTVSTEMVDEGTVFTFTPKDVDHVRMQRVEVVAVSQDGKKVTETIYLMTR